MPASSDQALLLYADSAHNADMRYFSGLHVPDPFIALAVGGRKIGLFNALEFGRALKESTLDDVLALEPFREQAKERWPDSTPGVADIVLLAAEKYLVDRFVVPEDFPAGLFEKLRRRGLTLEVATGSILPEREFKSASEARAIREGNRIAAAGIAAAEKVLAKSAIKGGKLLHRGEVLTSERLKFAIETACLEAGGVSLDTIAAGGDQACDPHNRGSGPLRPNELIIVDVFPRSQTTGYHGDMTRTFLRGRASEAQRALVDAVRTAQKAALKLIRDGVNGRDVHKACVDVFTKRGYETKATPTGSVGFFHGTGHGLGLAVHELPRLSGAVDYTLKTGAVATVEPGLYYPGLGGCRIEDVVQVTTTRPRLLSSAPYDWELG
ncbi:MAG: Xaa-Pro peptidase family protein [Opitutaceae bacterium]